jgi:tetratricopeptide (TPR) repeat protein
VNNKIKYKAYISYSHHDDKWASWLHRMLESYRVPRKLVGTVTDVGKVPVRVKPVFRDRDDLSSATDLGGTVQQALSDSENMIVICSPNSVASHWVNEEIRQFARMGHKGQIFCVIVDGDPGGVGKASTCFPAALEEIGMLEPLAADVRQWADGKHLSKLKLVSGMLGLPLDQLRRRDLQKRQKMWAMAAVASIALAVVLLTAVTSRITSEQRRDSGQSVVANKHSSLRILLQAKDDPQDLIRLVEWDQQDLARLVEVAGAGDNALMNAAIDLRNHGNASQNEADLKSALESYLHSWLLIAETYNRDRENQNAFFELGQAEFYIGQVFLKQGEVDKAQEAFMSYAVITWRLIRLQPENADWVLEMAYALTNLGIMQKDIDPNSPELHLRYMQDALEFNSLALVLDPSNEIYQSELGQSYAWLASALQGVCDIEGALQSFHDNVAEEEKIVAGDSGNITKRTRLAFALNGLSVVFELLGRTDDARIHVERALQLVESILSEDQDNNSLARYRLELKRRLIKLNNSTLTLDQSLQELEMLDDQWQPYLDDNLNETYGMYLLDRAKLTQMAGDKVMALQLMDRALNRTVKKLQQFPANRRNENQMMVAAFGRWELTQELPSSQVLSLIPDYKNSPGRTRGCSDAAMAVRQGIMSGDTQTAKELTEYLLGKGYRNQDFIRMCNAYSLCEG